MLRVESGQWSLVDVIIAERKDCPVDSSGEHVAKDIVDLFELIAPRNQFIEFQAARFFQLDDPEEIALRIAGTVDASQHARFLVVHAKHVEAGFGIVRCDADRRQRATAAQGVDRLLLHLWATRGFKGMVDPESVRQV